MSGQWRSSDRRVRAVSPRYRPAAARHGHASRVRAKSSTSHTAAWSIVTHLGRHVTPRRAFTYVLLTFLTALSPNPLITLSTSRFMYFSLHWNVACRMLQGEHYRGTQGWTYWLYNEIRSNPEGSIMATVEYNLREYKNVKIQLMICDTHASRTVHKELPSYPW